MILGKRCKRILRPLILLVGMCALSPSYAFNKTSADLFCRPDYQQSGGKNRAAASAKAKHGGKVLSVSESKKDGRVVYKVKLLLDSGRIKIVKIKGR